MNGAGHSAGRCRVGAVLDAAFGQILVVVTHPCSGQSRAAPGARCGHAME